MAEFLCSQCFTTVAQRDLTIVTSFDAERGWSGAFRCPADRGAAFEAARSALLFGGLSQDRVVAFDATLAHWGVPPAALRPFTNGESSEAAALTMLGLLERNVVRLVHDTAHHPRPIVLAIDAILACLIAPRGHGVDKWLLPMLRAGEARAVLLDFAVACAMHSIEPSDVVDTARWEEVLSHSDFQRATAPPDGVPSPEEVAHWRAVVFGED